MNYKQLISWLACAGLISFLRINYRFMHSKIAASEEFVREKREETLTDEKCIFNQNQLI